MTATLFTADQRILDSARRAGDADYDPGWDLLLSEATFNPIHTRIVSGRAHRVRESLWYALALLELDAAGDTEIDGEARTARAARVLARVIELQDTDPASETYGIWSYWAEEPLAEMNPPDWNWADFIGECLAILLRRHGDALDAGLRSRALTALGHAARSIIRRNVDLDYTNIAVKGTFVTLVAGELLGDAELREYGRHRLERLHSSLLEQGSFAEYNSPTYWNVVMQALTAIRQYIDDPSVHAAAADLERLAWEHFLRHWHPATGQLSGPMARCYVTDVHVRLGVLTPLQAVAGDTWPLLSRGEIRPDINLMQDAVLDYRIPADLRPLLDREEAGRTVSETFAQTHYVPGQVAGISAAGAMGQDSVVVPTVGTTWFDRGVTLGSVNFSDTWVQRRPILGFWAEPGDDPTDITQPARSVEIQVMRDGHGFAGGSFRSVQEDGTVLWAVAPATPSGDAHIHLDTIAPGAAVSTRELIIRFRIVGAPADAVRVDGTLRESGAVVTDAHRVQIDTAGLHLDWRLAAARARGADVRARVSVGDEVLIDIAWIDADEPEDVIISDLGETFAVGALRLSADPAPDAEVSAVVGDDIVRAEAGDLRLVAPTGPGSRLDHACIALRPI
ncbi:hypothetical protein [Microbacterium nymphoidis]|uniref:hypothetical protein n=1 Tax=Microbacterium nymphoidis TaxID=2898586 RepID=UPI001E4F2696|nr:hypothetical protein [Microbacterium nymphoidis]MCD2498539.1 hypothetical protein [Microbacterium nymphoidis]